VARKLKQDKNKCHKPLQCFDNKKNLAESIILIKQRLSKIAEKGDYLTLENEEL
jgi:hypothetical protein